MFIDIILADENMVSFDKFMDIDYKINSSDNNEILLGNASAASLNFSIWNGEKQYNTFKFKGSTCYLYKDAERTKKMGVFQVDKITKEKNSLKFECTDSMTKLDEIFKGVQTPFTIFSLIVQICTQLNISLRNTEEDFAHLTQTYSDTNDILGKKCREIIKWIGEVSCKYAIFDKEGQLYFSWYDLDTIKKEIPYNKLKDFARDEEELNITKVSVVIENEEQVVGLEEGYDLRLSTDNPFLKPLSVEARTSILQDIHSKVYGMHYLSCDIGIATDEDIKVGDTLKVYDEDGIDYKILVTYLNINKIFSMKITSAGENVNRNSSSGSSSGGSSGEKIKVSKSKDENWHEISIVEPTDTYMNGLSIFGVNEKSSATIHISIEFESNVEETIKFKLTLNDMLIKEFRKKTSIGFNQFTWSEQANLNHGVDTNTFKVLLNTEELTSGFLFKVDKNKSVLTLDVVGADTDGSGRVTNLEIKENIKTINLGNKNRFLIFNPMTDILEFLVQEPVKSNISEVMEELTFNSKDNIIIEDINETFY